MACIRCGGLQVVDDFADLWAVTGPMEFRGARCLNCGFIEDPVIRANRLQPPLTHRPQPSGMAGQGQALGLKSGQAG
ncbi:MAG TPA: hypothetical protein VES96_08415 [Nitrospiraceae bacterium]|nr:hypothetical protein [Nitrospiraceae bacterium]